LSTNPNRPQSAAAAAPPTADIGPTPVPTPTITFYQQQAADFMKALDEISAALPQLEIAHPNTVKFVRGHLNVSNEFLASAIAMVEQIPELQGLKKLDVTAARDTLQFIEAFRSVLDKVTAFCDSLKFTMDSRKASLAADALQIYDIAKGVARDANAAAVVAHLKNLKRDLGRRGRPRLTAPTPQAPAPQPGTTAQQLGGAAA
jgi:hypothetical protein